MPLRWADDTDHHDCSRPGRCGASPRQDFRVLRSRPDKCHQISSDHRSACTSAGVDRTDSAAVTRTGEKSARSGYHSPVPNDSDLESTARLLLGPLLRYVGERSATVWVETDRACDVAVLVPPGAHVRRRRAPLRAGRRRRSRTRIDHPVRGPPRRAARVAARRQRTAAERDPYARPRSPGPAPVRLLPRRSAARGTLDARARIRRRDAASTRCASTVCGCWTSPPTVARPAGAPWGPGVRGRLVAANSRADQERRAHLDESELTPDFEEVADFEEYTWLYREAWTPEVERWMFSVVPSAMIFDDHDMIDDWNISQSWVEEIRTAPWWQRHVIGGSCRTGSTNISAISAPNRSRRRGCSTGSSPSTTRPRCCASGPIGRSTSRRCPGGTDSRTAATSGVCAWCGRLSQRPRPRPGTASDGRRRRVGMGRRPRDGRVRPSGARDLVARDDAGRVARVGGLERGDLRRRMGSRAGPGSVSASGARSISRTGPRSVIRSTGSSACSATSRPPTDRMGANLLRRSR